MASVILRAQQFVGKVIVPRNLERPHRLVAKLLDEDKRRPIVRTTWISPGSTHQDAPHHSEALEVWAEWAISEADAVDPLSGSLGDLFQDPGGHTPKLWTDASVLRPGPRSGRREVEEQEGSIFICIT